MSRENLFPIDAVVTWVDGQDPKHLKKLNAYLSTVGSQRPRTADPTRFHNDGEINYCIISLLRFAPWLRTIFIVTDDQVPEIITKLKGTLFGDKIKIVDHRTIFSGYEDVLPTFNIRSILTVLWRIPGLSEKFLFLNDDFALIQPVRPENFFIEDGIVLRGEWRSMRDRRLANRIRDAWFKIVPKTKKQKLKDRAKHTNAQILSARLAGFADKYLWLRHEPHPWRVSTIRSFFENNKKLFEDNLRPKLREPNQFICEALAAYLELKSGNVLIDQSLKSLKLDPPDQKEEDLLRMIEMADQDDTYVFICVQSLEKARAELRQTIVTWMDKRIGTLDSLLQAPVSHF